MPSAAQRAVRKGRVGLILGAINDLETMVKWYGDTDKLEHGYLPHYEHHLRSRRGRRQTVWEIGVGGYGSTEPGGSLPVWRDYFPRSRIVGLDIEDKIFDFGRRVRFERADQSDWQDLQRAIDRHGMPAVVIDDGSHVGPHIQASFEYLWPRLPKGGIYVVEDLSTSYYRDWEGGNPAPKNSGVGLAQTLVDCVQALDPTFTLRPDYGSRDRPEHGNVGALHVYPGLFVAEKL